MGDFIADDGTKVGVNFFLLIPVTTTAIKNVRTVADVALIFIRPLHESVVPVFRFHNGSLSRRFRRDVGGEGGDEVL